MKFLNMYFETNEDKNYRYNLAKKGLNLRGIKNIKMKILLNLQKNHNKIVNIYNHNHINSLGGFINFIHQIFREFFGLRRTTKNNNLRKTEENIQNKAFEKARNKRYEQMIDIMYDNINKRIHKGNKRLPFLLRQSPVKKMSIVQINTCEIVIDYDISNSDNSQLTNYRNSQRYKYNNKISDYSRDIIIKRAIKELLNTELSIDYIVKSSYSSLIGSLGNSIAMTINPSMLIFIKIFTIN